LAVGIVVITIHNAIVANRATPWASAFTMQRCRWTKIIAAKFEDPKELYANYGDTPPPQGLDLLLLIGSHEWGMAGTYDAAWNETRKPLLPLDFDPRFSMPPRQD